MPLSEARPSSATIQAFRKGLAELTELGRAPRGLPSESFPQLIYSITLADVLKGKGMEHAKPMVWEFSVGGSPGPAVLVAVSKGRKPRVTSIARYPVAIETIRSLRRVRKLPVVKRNHYELRRLRIPALGVSAFWLKSMENDKADLAVPYRAIHSELQGMRPYTMEEFFAVVRPIAEKRVADEARLRRGK